MKYISKNIINCFFVCLIFCVLALPTTSKAENVIEPYGKTEYAVYWKGKEIMNADPKTWERIDDHYSKDEKNVYYENFAFIPPADPETFEILGDDYARDKNTVYHLFVDVYFPPRMEELREKERNPEDFALLKDGYARYEVSFFNLSIF